jgi:alpha-beta hydrolase superfamily lysophospholipase
MVLVHGFKAHSGLYEWPADQLRARGFAVYAHDHRGHGKSGGERYFVDSIDDYLDDLHAVVQIARSREVPAPVFMLGHSAGGVIAASYILDYQTEVGLAGFLCESFAFEVYAPDFALSVLKGVSHIAPHLHVLNLADESFSRDKAFVDRMRSDPLIPHERYPAQTVAELVRADQRLRKEFASITLPLFVMHGTADKVTKPEGSKLFHDKAGSKDKTLKLYEGHFHDLLNDVGKDRVMADLVEWMTLRIR